MKLGTLDDHKSPAINWLADALITFDLIEFWQENIFNMFLAEGG